MPELRFLWLAPFCLLASLAAADDSPCRGLEGRFAYVGQLLDGDPAQLFPNDPDVVKALFPEQGRIDVGAGIDRFRFSFEAGRVYLELHGPAGPVSRINVAGNRDFQYCDGEALVIERLRRTLAGSVYQFSRYRHVLRLDAKGDMLLESGVTSQYRAWMMAWERPKESWRIRFARVPRG